MLRLHYPQLLFKRLAQRVREHGDPVLTALAVAHHHLASIDIEVLYRSSTHSCSRSPAPYISEAMIQTGPCIRASSAATSDLDNTTGNRTGR